MQLYTVLAKYTNT